VQDVAACLVTGTSRCDHITPVLWQLHWLPVCQRGVFKIAGLIHQSLIEAAPAYLADDCRLLSDVGRRSLQSNSSDMRKLLVLRTYNKLGDRSFGRRSSTVERPFTRTTAAGTYLRLLQTISEISFIWQPKCLVTTESIGAIQLNLFIYLSTLTSMD